MELEFKKMGDTALITINRHKVLNALNFSLLTQLHHLLQEIQEKVVIITGAGEKAFVAGADIAEMSEMTTESWVEYCRLGRKVLSLLETGPFISIAAVNGYAFGGGMELALACDLVVASENATFAMPEVKLGVIPSFSGIPRLMKALGKYQTADLLFTGKSFSAAQGKERGLIRQIIPQKELLPACEKLAVEVMNHSFAALLGVKKVMHGEEEESVSVQCFEEAERKERMDAFLKRKKDVK